MSETCARKPGQMSPRKRRMIRKSLQNPSKMAPKWLPGGLWAASGAPRVSEAASQSSLGVLWAAPGAIWGRSWGRLEAVLGRPGAPGGSPRVPGRLPEGLWEVILEAIFAAGPCGTKKHGKSTNCLNFRKVFLHVILRRFFVLPAAPAPERTLRILVFARKVLQISPIGRFRAEPKNKEIVEQR